MKNIKFIFVIVLLITFILSADAKGIFKFGFDINVYSYIKENPQTKGIIYLREIKNARPKKDGGDNNMKIGTGSFLNSDIVEIVKDLTIKSLNYSGYKVVTTSSDGKYPILDIEINEYYIKGFGAFQIYNKLKIKLFSPSGTNLLYENNISDENPLYMPKSYAINVQIYYEALEKVFYLTMKNLIDNFESDKFNSSYNGNPNIENNKKIEDSLIEKVETHKISKIQKFDSYPNLKYLKLLNRISKIENLDKLNNLIDLNLNINDISKIENLDNLTNLQWLIIGDNKISKIENLDKLVNLKWIYLGYNKLKRIENLDNQTNLIWLNLNSNSIEKIENLDNLKNLIILDLTLNSIKKIENLDNLTNLLYLKLGCNTGIKKIENLDKLTNLQVLDLADCSSIEKIENLNELQKLQVLDLSFCNSIKKIENLDNLTNLTELYLNGTNIKKIENLDNLKNLKKLDITDSNISKIENLENLDSLEILLFKERKQIFSISESTYNFLKNKNIKFYGEDVEKFVKSHLIMIKK